MLAVLLGAAILSGRSQDAPPPPKPEKPAVDTAAIERGRQEFGRSCAFCHGPDATGARGPDLVRSPILAHDVKGDAISKVIHDGRPDKGMPALSLTDQQTQDIAAFLHSRLEETLESSSVPKGYPAEKLLTGNADAGKTYFNGAGGCTRCHSATGDLSEVAAKHPAVELQSYMLYPEGEYTTAIVTLPSGQKITGPLEHIDEFVIALHEGDKAGPYRSFRRDQVKLELHDRLVAHRELLEKITPAEMHNLYAYLQTLK